MPAAFRYALIVPRRMPVARWMRSNGHPRRVAACLAFGLDVEARRPPASTPVN
jgi:hypothetical protein